MKAVFQTCLLLLTVVLTATADDDLISMAGASSASPPLQDAADILKKEKGLEIQISTGSGSDGAIDGLGQGQIDVGLYAGELLGSVKARYPQVIFTPSFIGRQVVVFAVSGDVWDAGVHSLSAGQIRKIYQKRITNWKDLGGPDREISFFDWDTGDGLWEMTMNWVYGDCRRAPSTRFPILKTPAETLKALNSTPGAMVMLPANLAGAPKDHFLALADEDGNVTPPSVEAIAQDKYPINRPILLVTNNRATLDARTLVEFMRSPRGQDLVRKYGFYAADDLKAAKDPHLSDQ